MRILLKEVMRSKNLTVRQVSIITGIPRSTINDIMNGTVPRIDTLETLAKGLKIHISDLYESDFK